MATPAARSRLVRPACNGLHSRTAATRTKSRPTIVLAAGSRRGAKIMTFVSDLSEAKVVMSVLESGPDGVIMTPRSAAEVEALGRLCSPVRGQLALKEFSVTEIADAGTG